MSEHLHCHFLLHVILFCNHFSLRYNVHYLGILFPTEDFSVIALVKIIILLFLLDAFCNLNISFLSRFLANLSRRSNFGPVKPLTGFTGSTPKT